MSRPRTHPDEFTRARKLAWSRARSQAVFREEPWNLPFEDFCDFWSNQTLWNQRGRQRDCLVLYRKDTDKPWSKDNCELITRYEQFWRTVYKRMEYTDD